MSQQKKIKFNTEDTQNIDENNPILIWGGRSQARIIQEMIKENFQGSPSIIFDHTLDKPLFNSKARFINNIEMLKKEIKKIRKYVVCIGSEYGFARVNISEYLDKFDLEPLNIIHRTSYIDCTSLIKNGYQVMPHALVHKFALIGKQVIINSGASIEHECIIGDGVHIMSQAAISGRVTIEDFATIGTNSTILPNLKIGKGAIIGAGAVVTKDVEPYTTVAGVPAKFLTKNTPVFLSNFINL